MLHGSGGRASHFGSLVREYRHEAGLTQRQLAARSGLSLAALRDFEQSRRHRPRANSLAALAEALGLDPDQIASLGRAAALPRERPAPVSSSHSAGEGLSSGRAAPAAGRGPGLWLATLGPLEAWRDGTPLSLGPPARRAVLGLLLMDPGTRVRRDAIVDVLWGDSPPRTAVGLVQAHVSRIRKILSPPGCPAGDEVISSVRGAYRLVAAPWDVDLLVVRDLGGRAAAAWADGDEASAVDYYEQAVGLWRGEPFADVDELSGHPGIISLRLELNGMLLRYAEAACAIGQYHRVLPRLRALAHAEPLNELAHARLMIALAGSGQQAAALRLYGELRSRLDRELGIYPGDELTQAYVRVLRQDLSMGSPVPPLVRSPAAGQVIPRQLPVGPRALFGCHSELAALTALMEPGQERAGSVVIAALTGMAGVGKTALAVYWTHQVADLFPDGQLFVNLRGAGPSGLPIAPTNAVRGFLTALGVPITRIPADTDGQAALYRSLLAGRRMLVVLDNARNAEQVRPLLPASPGCLVVVTSRNRLIGLAAAEGAHLMTLGLLSTAESRDLLAANLDPVRARAEPAAVGELIALCGRLPLALCDVAARAVARPGLPLGALLAEMQDERGRLDALETGEPVTSVRMVFSWSQARLNSLALRMFRLLGMHPGPDITIPAAASLAGLPLDRAALAITELCDEHLLTEYAPGRFVLHDLLRSYSAEEANLRESEADRRDAILRMLDHYLHAATVASGFLDPGQPETTWIPSRPGVTPEKIDGPEQAAEWFSAEQHVLLGVIRQAAQDGYAPYSWKLPWSAGWYLRGEACWQRLAAAQEAALAVAGQHHDLAGLLMARQHLGWLKFLLGDIPVAAHHLNEALELAGQVTDGGPRALARDSHASAGLTQDRVLESMIQARQALALYCAAGDAQGEARVLYAIGGHLIQVGEHELAVTFSSRALVAYRQALYAATESGARALA